MSFFKKRLQDILKSNKKCVKEGAKEGEKKEKRGKEGKKEEKKEKKRKERRRRSFFGCCASVNQRFFSANDRERSERKNYRILKIPKNILQV